MEREGVPDLGLTVVYCKCKTECTLIVDVRAEEVTCCTQSFVNVKTMLVVPIKIE